jgi:tripartite-type tricarboxylate transporter receptor subunit TctC
MKKISICVMLSVILSVFLLTSGVYAEWPKKPILISIPWPPTNDSTTMIANAMAPVMSNELGVPVKIINKPGGRGILGTNFVAQSKPDGYTVALSSIGPMLTQPLRGVTPYKIDDFKCLGLTWAAPFMMLTRADSPYNNLNELADYAKNHKIKLGHYGIGAVPTLIAMGVAKNGGFNWEDTTFGEINALLLTKKDVDVTTGTLPPHIDYIKKNEVKALAVLNPAHYPLVPDVKTVSEQGFGNDYMVWFGIFMPAKTPEDVRNTFEKAWFKAMKTPKVQEVIKNTGVVLINMDSKSASKQISLEREFYGNLMKELGITKK